MLRRICREMTGLEEADICRLEALEQQLPLMAELTGSDVFLDCVTPGGEAVVVAQARPSQGVSVYQQDIRGQLARQADEPAVYHALEMQVPARDIRAVTQENRTVRQDVVPVPGAGGRCIAALIREKDISGAVRQEQKYEELARSHEQENSPLCPPPSGEDETVIMREVHHRVKNSLQLVASILNLQARRCGDAAARKILQENVGRVLSIASIHDILTRNQSSFSTVDSMALLEALKKNLQSFLPEGQQISICTDGDSVPLSADTASSVSIVVNELVTNALEHAFPCRAEGTIRVSFWAGARFHTVTVTDDGCGFPAGEASPSGFGLRIVEATVRDKLQGTLRIQTDAGGSRITFDFKNK